MTRKDYMSVADFRKILKKFKKNPDQDVSNLIAKQMVGPHSCCAWCLVCCCHCLIAHEIEHDMIDKSLMVIKLFNEDYKGMSVTQIMALMQSAVNIIDRHKIKPVILDQYIHEIRAIFPKLTEEEVLILQGARLLITM